MEHTPTESGNVCIIIPAHNRKSITLGCLERLSKLGALDRYLTILVDDGSSDGTESSVREAFPSVYLIKGNGCLWWTGAITLAMKEAYSQGADYFVWLNDDCLLSSDSIHNLVSLCRSRPNLIAGAQGYSIDKSSQVVFGGKRKTWRGYRWLSIPEGQTAQCDLLSGNLVCLPRSVVDEIGYPDVYNTPHYGGDALYLIRAQKANFHLWVDARSPVYDTAPHDSPLYPQQWLIAEGSIWRLVKLVFTPQSGLSWRVWFWINWESQGFWGVVMLLKKYLSVLLITILRTLPKSFRTRLHSRIVSLGV